ncbi:TraB/GumN family protein [Desulfovibrio sp. OttesenSCG-928-G11]|nr:TraB/GumN family protein [Desulfovibrio sp. OttesenSCG-928-G11]
MSDVSLRPETANADPRRPLEGALVPEHSLPFMSAASGGTPFLERGYLFLRGEDWLMGIGYPTASHPPGDMLTALAACRDFEPEDFAAAFADCRKRLGALHCYCIAPYFPDSMLAFVTQQDYYYLLDAESPVPASLKGPVAGAARVLRLSEDRLFTAGHRRLWAEFLGRAAMRPNVRELYARTEALLAASRGSLSEGGPKAPALDLRLLSAWDQADKLVACLLLDYSPGSFVSYIIGAHSKLHYAPHATDLLFARLLESARQEGKAFIHLGLGVNEGIARFKKKWGAKALIPYAMASWRESAALAARPRPARRDLGLAVEALLAAPAGLSKQQIFDSLPQQRPFAMIHAVEKGGARSWLCGSAHFFRYSFELAFRELFDSLHTVIFEGPLDEDFLKAVERSGLNPEAGASRIVDAMSAADIDRLLRRVNGPQGRLLRLLGFCEAPKVDVRGLLRDARPWFAFFSIWVAWLERMGWRQSVDLEAWRTAKDMGKAVIAMENLDEQLDSLESVPIDRICAFFRCCDQWPAFIRRNVASYLNGDLKAMTGSSIEFPSRTEQVIDRRDERFRQRMRPFLEEGGCAVFVGSAHLLGLIPMLREDGFTVRRHYPTWRLKIRAALAGEGDEAL